MKIQNLKFKIIFSLILFFGIFGLVEDSEAAISLPWSTTFNCAETYITDNWQCDQLQHWGGGECYCKRLDGVDVLGNPCSGGSGCEPYYWVNKPGIFNVANNDKGSGNGFREWIWTNLTGNESTYNIMIIPISGPPSFAIPQKELWIRWYMRFQSGINIANSYYMKTMYIRTGGSSECVADFSEADGFILGVQGGGGPNNAGALDASCTSCGLQTMSHGQTITDNTWHSIEIHIKMDTTGTPSSRYANGVAQFWLDGELKINNTTINWSNGDIAAQQGWTWFDFPNNFSDGVGLQMLTGGQEMYIDWDDVAVYNANPAPTNKDAAGNNMIGPIGWSNSGDTVAPASPSGLSVS